MCVFSHCVLDTLNHRVDRKHVVRGLFWLVRTYVKKIFFAICFIYNGINITEIKGEKKEKSLQKDSML